MFHVTLRRLNATATHTDSEVDQRTLGAVASADFLALLEAFRAIDPVDNATVEPEIVAESRQGRHVVRTAGRRLMLQNLRDTEQPAVALSAEEIIAELDGSASVARRLATMAFTATLAPFPVAEEEPAYVPPPRPPEKSSTVMAVIAVAMGAALAVQLLAARASPGAHATEPVWLTAADGAEAQQARLAGVYVTGTKPGQHGMIVGADGSLKIFELNAAIAPSVLVDTYRLGQLDGRLVLATSQPGGAITVTDRDTLAYCGENYRRVP